MAQIIEDQFNDTDAVAIASHIPDIRPGSNTWLNGDVGTFIINTNKGKVSAAANSSHATIDSGVSDCIVSAQVRNGSSTISNARLTGVVFRRAAGAWSQFFAGIIPGSDAFSILRFSGTSTPTVVGTATASIDLLITADYKVVVTLSGSSIIAKLYSLADAELASVSITDTQNQTATRHGITTRDTTSWIEWFKVDTASGGTDTGSVDNQDMSGLIAGTPSVYDTYLESSNIVVTHDVNINNNSGGTNNGGTHSGLQFGNYNTGPMRFILESIPDTAVVIQAVLRLTTYDNTGIGTADIYEILPANGSWIEGIGNLQPALAGEPCWNALASDGSGGITTPWAGGSNGCDVPGVDRGSVPIGHLNATGLGTHSVILDPSVVQGWFGQSSNPGIIWIATITNSQHIALKEYATAEYRPSLDLFIYNPTEEPPAKEINYYSKWQVVG